MFSDCSLLFSLVLLLLMAIVRSTQVHLSNANGIKTAVFLSPKFDLEPGSVAEKLFHNIDFPRGHIAIKSFVAEVVDEAGNPVPLYETYLHHWIAMRYYRPKAVENSNSSSNQRSEKSDYVVIKNNGICDDHLPQYFGLGSETRKTATAVPDPYGIEVGNPAEIPAGYEEGWILNLHAIDTRGAEDKLGCTECRCDLYNVTQDEDGNALEPEYIGGMRCCYEETKCRLIEGYRSPRRSFFMKYTVKYVDWDNSILPAKIYILDVTARWQRSNNSKESNGHNCQIEYLIESCSTNTAHDDCIHTKSVSIVLPSGGEVIYGVAHQHTGGLGSTLYGEDGRVICSSIPIYGQGMEPGNESGYIVGMSTCYPQPGSIKISSGESLTLVSNYSNAQRHTGVMGLFYILVADPDQHSPNATSAPHASVHEHKKTSIPHYVWVVILLFQAALVLALVITYQRKCRKAGYESIAT
nr:uncharacterized protein LOC113741681 [Coffea arabica]XP_027125077.1 uncharacterized protein LOC113741681 [Coffea arabica]XP_027125079.1 uncharacterized protein LOC113741681 [Coffea arabica]